MKKLTFKGGIHPLSTTANGKLPTRGEPIREYVSDSVCIAMDQHLGAPSTPCVKKGDKVLMGQVIGEANGPRGIPVHASVSGLVTEVGPRQMTGKGPSTCVCIQNDFNDNWVELHGLGNVEKVDPALIVPAIREAGICGLGGACFPTHAKLTIPEGKTIDTIILNGAECETFLTADHRLMVEEPMRVVDGLRAVMRALNVKNGVIAIEDNKMDAVKSIREAAYGREGVSVAVMRTKYPQGGEKQLIYAVTGREVPNGKLPMDVGAVVLNVATAAAIADAIVDGRPLVDRVVTVTGCIREPGNLRLRIGTVFQDAVGACGGYDDYVGKIISGGSMTGLCAPNDMIATTKGCGGIVAIRYQNAKSLEETACIRCGKCVDACPMGLNPYLLKNLCDLNDLKGAKDENLMACIMCGSCAYVCPARRWLVASFKNARELINIRGI